MSYDTRFAKAEEWKFRMEEIARDSSVHGYAQAMWIINFINMLLRDREQLRHLVEMVKLPRRFKPMWIQGEKTAPEPMEYTTLGEMYDLIEELERENETLNRKLTAVRMLTNG